MLTLSYGFQQPEDGDEADDWWDAMAANMAQLNAHTHNGTDSSPLTSVLSSELTTQDILAASWGADLGGSTYRQLITLPTVAGVQLQYDAVSIDFRLSTGHRVYPTIEKVSGTTFYVYTNDNTLAYVAVYTT